MKKILLCCVIVCIATKSFTQMYLTKTGFISFFSKTPLEDIKADNNQVYAVIDAGKKNIAFTLLMKGFLFARELQQEHFNENYVESDKYPKASFTGTYAGDVDFSKDGVYNVSVKGILSVHNVGKQIETPAKLEVKAGRLLGRCSFVIKPEDYNISIPSIVRDKIAKEITVSVQIDCNPR